MLKKINADDAKKILDFIDCWIPKKLEGYSQKGAWKAYEKYLELEANGKNGLETFIEQYNKYVDFRNSNCADYLVIKRKTNELSVLYEIRKKWFQRTNHSSLKDGEWMSRKEIQDYLEKDYYIYVIKYKDYRVEREIDSVEELIDYTYMTFAEATEKWGLGESTLRSIPSQDRLIEGVDYRKSGKVWLITGNAMKKLYGEPKKIINKGD